MAAAVIGALRVNLGLDSAKFERGLKKSKTSLSGFEKAVSRGIVAAGAAIAAAFAGISVAVKSTINDMDKLAKTSQKIGVPVEELSKLRFAADLAGVSFDQLTNGLGKLAKSMSDSLTTPTSEAARGFEALGINVLDAQGKMKSVSQVVSEVATKFAGFKDDAGKTAIAMAIFGRAGRDLIPLLNEGAAGIKKMTDEAAALGLEISTNTAKKAELFNDTLTRLRSVFDGVINDLTEGMLDGFNDVAGAMLESARSSEVWITIGKGLSQVFKAMSSGLVFLIAQFKILVVWITQVGKALQAVASLDFGAFKNAISEATDQTIKMSKKMKDDIVNIWTGVPEKIDKEAAKVVNRVDTTLMKGTASTKKSRDELKDILTDSERDVMRFWESTADIFQRAGSGLFDDLVNGALNLKKTLQDLLKDIGSLLANNVMRQILTGSFGAGAATGGGLIGGLAGMFSGFATGGSFDVGGAGGMDSQLVAFRASPNETVSVTKPGQERSSGGGNVTIINESKATVEEGPSGTDSEGNRFQRLYVRDAIHEALPSGLKRQQGFNIRPTVARR